MYLTKHSVKTASTGRKNIFMLPEMPPLEGIIKNNNKILRSY